MGNYHVSKYLDSYSDALVKVIKSYPDGIVWSSNSLRIALNRFVSPKYAKLSNAIHVGYAMRCLKTLDRFKILVTKGEGSMAKYIISLVNDSKKREVKKDDNIK